jgi:uncharacterized protein YbjQ (UPF0145 family)
MAQEPRTHRQAADLPEAARARLARVRAGSTWDSPLSSKEFAAVKGVAFEPLGQVLGAAVFNVGYPGDWICSGAWTFTGGTDVSSAAWAPFSQLVKTMYAARRLALARAVAECRALGGDGIVGMKVRAGEFPAGGLEFTALGTAVRARTGVRPRRPFTSHLSGQDFAKLPRAGWIPTGLAFGISVATRHDDWLASHQTRRSRLDAGNQEVDGYTRLINHARHGARLQLARDTASQGADGVVLDEMELRVRERECPPYANSRDHIAEAIFVGTSIARFGRSRGPTGPGPLTILRLGPER